MQPVRSPEVALLLMACSEEQTSEKLTDVMLFLAQHSLNWDRLLKLAAWHRLTPLLYRLLQESPTIAGPFLSTLRQECLAITTDNLIKLREYHQVSALLTKENISHCAFKGIYLAQYSYPASSLRPIGDMDILIVEEDLDNAVDLLALEGYSVAANDEEKIRHANRRVRVDELHEISLLKPFSNTSRFDIDLHWRVDCLVKEIGSFRLDDMLSSPDFLIEQQIVLLVLHHGINNSWARIGYVCDLYFLLNKAAINWSWLLDKLKLYEAEVIFLVGVHWCQQLFHLVVPTSVQQTMPTDQIRLLAESYEKQWESDSVAPFRNLVSKYAYAQPPLLARLRIYGAYARNFIFRSSLIRINAVQVYIPKDWGFTTVLIRAFSALRRNR